tara:strand:+ start:1350 stop:1571 length:222 start_codon:yes stop_codon:yes gene_type:complete
MDGSHSLENTEPRYFVVRLPGAFTYYGEEAGYQTVVLARTANEAFESACDSNSWEILPFEVEQVHVFPKEVKL